MRDWRYDFIVNDNGARPMIDLRVDGRVMEYLERRLDQALGAPIELVETRPRTEANLDPGNPRQPPERGRG